MDPGPSSAAPHEASVHRVGSVKRTLIAGAVVVGVLVGGAAIADGVLRERTEQQIADDLPGTIAGLDSEPVVTIDGFPFLTQVLAGELADVHVTAPSATVDGLRMRDIDVRLAGVSTDQPTTAREARMEASVSLADLEETMGFPVDLTIEEDQLTASVSVLMLPIAVALTPVPVGRTIEVEVESLSLAGVTVDADDVPFGVTDQIDGLAFPIDGLPEGLELTSIIVRGEGFRLVAAGTDLVLDAAAPS